MPPLEIVLPFQVRRIEKPAPSTEATNDATAHAQGFTAGYAEGRLRAEWEAARQREKDNARMRALAQKLENLHHEFEGLVSEHLPDLIYGALHRVFRSNPFTIDQVRIEVSALLRDMEQAGRISLECAAEEAEELRLGLEQSEAVPGGSKWTLQANPGLKPGEFILKSDLGDVDGRHSSRIRQIHHALEGAR